MDGNLSVRSGAERATVELKRYEYSMRHGGPLSSSRIATSTTKSGDNGDRE